MADSVSELTWYDLPPLRRPLLLVAFQGLFDAAEAATGALDWICKRTESESIGMVDPERFYNFQEARPVVRIDDDGSRVIDWPTPEIWSVPTSSSRDLVVMTGVEPHLRWPTFADHVLEVARHSGCEMVVTVGAFIGMVPHTRPFSVVGSAVHPDLARRLNLSRPTYQGPTGVVGVINSRLEQSSVPVISLRVEVPPLRAGRPQPQGHPGPAAAARADHRGRDRLRGPRRRGQRLGRSGRPGRGLRRREPGVRRPPGATGRLQRGAAAHRRRSGRRARGLPPRPADDPRCGGGSGRRPGRRDRAAHR